MEGKGTWEEDAMTAMHRKAFYMKAYPVANSPELLAAKPQSKSASMKTCRPKTEVDYIKNVIHRWGKGIEIRNMEDGEEKNRLLSFRRRNKVGNKYIHQYCLEEVWAPGDDKPRQVLRRLEAKKGSLDKTLQEGRIVVSREELFDAINEWHQHSWSGEDLGILPNQVLECHSEPCQALLHDVLYMHEEKSSHIED